MNEARMKYLHTKYLQKELDDRRQLLAELHRQEAWARRRCVSLSLMINETKRFAHESGVELK